MLMPEPRAGVALRVEVDDEHPVAEVGQAGAEVHRGRGLAHAALLVGDGHDPGQGRRKRPSEVAASLRRGCRGSPSTSAASGAAPASSAGSAPPAACETRSSDSAPSTVLGADVRLRAGRSAPARASPPPPDRSGVGLRRISAPGVRRRQEVRVRPRIDVLARSSAAPRLGADVERSPLEDRSLPVRHAVGAIASSGASCRRDRAAVQGTLDRLDVPRGTWPSGRRSTWNVRTDGRLRDARPPGKPLGAGADLGQHDVVAGAVETLAASSRPSVAERRRRPAVRLPARRLAHHEQAADPQQRSGALGRRPPAGRRRGPITTSIAARARALRPTLLGSRLARPRPGRPSPSARSARRGTRPGGRWPRPGRTVAGQVAAWRARGPGSPPPEPRSTASAPAGLASERTERSPRRGRCGRRADPGPSKPRSRARARGLDDRRERRPRRSGSGGRTRPGGGAPRPRRTVATPSIVVDGVVDDLAVGGAIGSSALRCPLSSTSSATCWVNRSSASRRRCPVAGDVDPQPAVALPRDAGAARRCGRAPGAPAASGPSGRSAGPGRRRRPQPRRVVLVDARRAPPSASTPKASTQTARGSRLHDLAPASRSSASVIVLLPLGSRVRSSLPVPRRRRAGRRRAGSRRSGRRCAAARASSRLVAVAAPRRRPRPSHR